MTIEYRKTKGNTELWRFYPCVIDKEYSRVKYELLCYYTTGVDSDGYTYVQITMDEFYRLPVHRRQVVERYCKIYIYEPEKKPRRVGNNGVFVWTRG